MKKWIVFLVLLGAFFVAAMVAVVLLAGEEEVEIEPESVLVLELDGGVGEVEGTMPIPFLERPSVTLREVIFALHRAADDERIAGVLLKLGASGLNLAQVQELRAALEDVGSDARPVVAYAELYGNGGYYLASACDRIALLPTGIVDLRGIAVSSLFLRGTLDKLGVEPEFEHVGKYKSAGETFTEKKMSDPARESIDAILDGIFGQLLEGIAAGRGWTVEEARAAVDEGPYEAQQAFESELVDQLVYEDQWAQLFDFLDGVDEQDLPLVDVQDYVRAARPDDEELAEETIALIYGVGSIHSGESESNPLRDDQGIGSATMAAAIRDARLDEEIDALVLRVDSPGGSGIASDVIWREVSLASERMPVIVSMGGVAASGGYYISAPADEIFLDPGTITGSIGVLGGKFNLAGLYEKIGVSHETLRRGRHSDLFSETRPWTVEERERVRRSMEVFYDGFVTKVAAARESDWESIHAVAQGRVWIGTDAHALGLVDHLGGLREAILRTKTLLGIDPEKLVRLRILPEEKPFLERLLSGELFGSSLELDPLDGLLGGSPLLRHRRLFESSRPGEPLALMPYSVELDP